MSTCFMPLPPPPSLLTSPLTCAACRASSPGLSSTALCTCQPWKASSACGTLWARGTSRARCPCGALGAWCAGGTLGTLCSCGTLGAGGALRACTPTGLGLFERQPLHPVDASSACNGGN
jgi:hypothetical protein